MEPWIQLVCRHLRRATGRGQVKGIDIDAGDAIQRGPSTIRKANQGVAEAVGKKRAGNTASLIYDQLRADINSGKLEAGSPLSQLAIAEAHGTSRGPVREALRRLQQDQLVIAHENRRFNVAPFALSEMESFLSLHLVNVTLAIRVSVPLLTDDEIEQLRRAMRLLEEAVDDELDVGEQAYRTFILTMIRHAGSRVVSLVEGLIDNIERHRRGVLANAPEVTPQLAVFRPIFEAAAARDGKRASALYAKLGSRISMLILAGAAPEYDAFRLRGYVAALSSSLIEPKRSDRR